MRNILNLIRIKDWLKNIILFLPLIFSGYLFNFSIYNNLILGFITFSLVSSCIYILNDILDIDRDKSHPIKRYTKPLANNSISLKSAYYLFITLIILSIFLIYFYPYLRTSIFLYVSLSLIYNFGLKKIPYLEIIILATGYVIRVDAGSKLINVESSYLMIMSIFALGLYLILLKRLSEKNLKIDLYKNNSRDVLKYYHSKNLKLLSLLAAFSLCTILLFYVLTVNIKLVLSFLFIIVFLLRYYFLTSENSNGESPITFILFNRNLLILSFIILISFITIYI